MGEFHRPCWHAGFGIAVNSRQLLRTSLGKLDNHEAIAVCDCGWQEMEWNPTIDWLGEVAHNIVKRGVESRRTVESQSLLFFLEEGGRVKDLACRRNAVLVRNDEARGYQEATARKGVLASIIDDIETYNGASDALSRRRSFGDRLQVGGRSNRLLFCAGRPDHQLLHYHLRARGRRRTGESQ